MSAVVVDLTHAPGGCVIIETDGGWCVVDFWGPINAEPLPSRAAAEQFLRRWRGTEKAD